MFTPCRNSTGKGVCFVNFDLTLLVSAFAPDRLLHTGRSLDSVLVYSSSDARGTPLPSRAVDVVTKHLFVDGVVGERVTGSVLAGIQGRSAGGATSDVSGGVTGDDVLTVSGEASRDMSRNTSRAASQEAFRAVSREAS